METGTERFAWSPRGYSQAYRAGPGVNSQTARLNFEMGGWTRLGIIASVLWALGASYFAFNTGIDDAERAGNVVYDACFNLAFDREQALNAACARLHKTTVSPTQDDCGASAKYETDLKTCGSKREQASNARR
jgi:hypothetical protein